MLVFADHVDRTAFDVLHDEIRHALDCLATVEQPRDVRMTEIGEDLHLVAKALADRIAAKTGFDQLNRDLLVIVLVVALGKLDGAHAAVTELAQDPVRTDARAFFSRGFIVTPSCGSV